MSDPLLTTDQPDYSPGSTATITAAGFGIGDDLNFQITVIDPATGTTLWSGPSWDLIEGSDGSGNGLITTNFFVTSDYANTTIKLTVTDMATGQVATDVFTDSPPPSWDTADGDPPERSAPGNVIDLTTANAVVGPANLPSVDTHGAVFEQATPPVSANGQFKAFLIIQEDGNENSQHGYNTAALDDHGHQLYPLDDKSLVGTASPIVNVNDLQTITVSGVDYYGFVLSINQDGSHPNLSLDSLQIFQSSHSDLTGTTSADANGKMSLDLGSDASLVYDLGNTEVKLDASLTSGNSHGDATVLIPVGDFDLSSGKPYIYLYSAFGQEDGFTTNGGFEQWSAIATAPTAPAPSISIDKEVSVDGGKTWFDIGTALDDPKLLHSAGADLQYRFIVTNTGNETLTGVTLTDNPAISALTAAVGDIGTLDPNKSVTITVNGDYADGYQLDTATVTGTGQTSGQSVQATDQADYTGELPGVTLDKGVSGDGTTYYQLGSDTTVPVILVGKPVYFEALVGNTNNDIAVTDAGVSDSNPSGTFSGPTTIAAGSSGNLYTGVSTTALADAHTDTATFSGTASDDGGHSSTWTASDTATYFGAAPAITIEKDVSVDGGTTWFDANNVTGPTLLASGVAPQFQYIVTNTGNVDLTNIAVTDDVLGSIGSIASLGAGKSTTLTATGTWGSGQQTNTGEAKGTFTDSVGNSANLDVTDPAHYFGAAPAITIEKDVSVDGGKTWFDANSATGPTLLASGAAPEFQYIVKNTGNVDLTNIAVTDDKLGNIGTITTLAAGDSATLTATGTWAAGQQTNTGEATDTFTDSAGNSAKLDVTDPANYFGATQGLTIDKQVSIDGGATWHDVGSATDNPYALVGSTVEFRVVVTNTSNLLDETIGVTDNNPAGTFTFGGASSVTLHAGASATSDVLTTTAVLGSNTDTATATGTETDSAGDIGTVKVSDTATYVGLKPDLQSEYLTKGFWSNHVFTYDGDGADKIGDNWWSGTAAPKSNPYGNEGQLYFSSTSTKDVISQSSDLNLNKTYVVLGDTNLDGSANDGHDLQLKIADAATLMTTSTTGDARIILASQAYASQLNDYNLHGEPNGLLEAAVKWLTTSSDPLASHQLTGGSVDGGDGTLTAGTDYNVTKGVFSFTGSPLSSSSHAWQTMVNVDDLGSVTASSGSPITTEDGVTHTSGTFEKWVTADGNGLANALTAFNQGQLVLLSDGVTPNDIVAWYNGTSYVDIHHNDPGAFWATLNGHVGGVGIGYV